LGQEPHPDSDVISLLDLEGQFFSNLTADDLAQFKELLVKIPKSRVLWITRASQMACDDARYALVLGVARTIRNESQQDFATFEIDDFDSAAANSSVCVLETVQGQGSHGGREKDYEFALKNGIIHVSRFHWMPADKQRADSEKSGVKVLDVGAYGVLSSLSWIEQPSVQLKDDQVEVDIKYIGLNFRVCILSQLLSVPVANELRQDIMVAMGFMGDKKELGLEASGVVHRVGPQVKHLRVGDRVMLVGNGLFCNRKVISEDCCFALSPELGLSLEDAATVPSVQSTVLYSLLKVANIQRGQSILIHSACGGVGLAAIQLCQQLGVQVRTLVPYF
jgi:hypothetical protein